MKKKSEAVWGLFQDPDHIHCHYLKHEPMEFKISTWQDQVLNMQIVKGHSRPKSFHKRKGKTWNRWRRGIVKKKVSKTEYRKGRLKHSLIEH